MKTDYWLATICALLFLLVNPLPAQIIRETTVDYDKQRVAALTASITPPRKDLQDAFEDWMDDTYDINMKGGGLFSDKNIRQAEDVTLPAVADGPITLYTKTVSDDEMTNMYLFAARGEDDFIPLSNSTAFAELERLFDDFLSFYLPEYYEERVAEAVEQLEELRDDLADLRDDIADNEKKIQDLRKENIDLEAEAGELEKAIRDAEAQLERRRDARQRISRQLRSGGER